MAAVAFVILGSRGTPLIGPIKAALAPDPATCPLSGMEPKKDAVLDRPAVAVKIENNPIAYPLSGLEDAEVVYEELVEGGLTRFLALFHCTDARKAGPVRSSRAIDPTIMVPVTRILVAAGGNDAVRSVLDKADIVLIDEPAAGDAMQRIEREGIASEHTLYADTKAVRNLGAKEFDSPTPDDLFEFGELQAGAKRARTISISFGGASTVRYEWSRQGWKRFDGDEPLVSESGEQVTVDNVLVEEHAYNFSTITDVAGARSVEIEDVTGSGRALLFRDGRVLAGRWERESVEGAATFLTKSGDQMVFAPGTIWIELAPSQRGEAKGSVSFEKS